MAAAVFILLATETVLRGRVSPILVLLAYGACLVFVLMAVVIALVDARAIARRVLGERRDLLNEALHDIESRMREKRKGPPSSGD